MILLFAQQMMLLLMSSAVHVLLFYEKYLKIYDSHLGLSGCMNWAII